MKIKWLGHAAFLIATETGTKIITDPYLTAENLSYAEIKESADIVTVSHEHGDHSNLSAVRGNPEVIRKTAEVKGIELNGIPTYHDNSGGSQKGSNTVFYFEVDRVSICHFGDLGHPLSDKQIAGLGSVDLLLIPVGGNYTIDAKVATEICDKIKPRVIIPMHYKNEKCSSFPVAGVDEFLQGKNGVSKPDASEVEFKKETLPDATQIIVLKPAL